MGIKFRGVFNFADFVGDFCSRKLIPRKYSLRMCITCTQCMCTCKNAKLNPLKIKKLRTFYKNTKFYILKILYPYSIMYFAFMKLKLIKINFFAEITNLQQL